MPKTWPFRTVPDPRFDLDEKQVAAIVAQGNARFARSRQGEARRWIAAAQAELMVHLYFDLGPPAWGSRGGVNAQLGAKTIDIKTKMSAEPWVTRRRDRPIVADYVVACRYFKDEKGEILGFIEKNRWRAHEVEGERTGRFGVNTDHFSPIHALYLATYGPIQHGR